MPLEDNEIDQRPEREIFFRCTCGFDHFVVFSGFDWDDEDFLATTSVIDTIRSVRFGNRLRVAWSILRHGQRHLAADICLNTADLEKISAWCISEVEARKARLG